jgi:PAS domain S-box-containing protein
MTGGDSPAQQAAGVPLGPDLLDTLQVGVWAVDADGVSTWANRFMGRLLGRPLEQIIGHPLIDFWYRDDFEIILTHIRRRRQGASDHYDARLKRSDGTPVPVRVQASPLHEHGVFVGAVAFLTDLTDVTDAAAARDAALLEAQQAMVATSRLLSWVSHELRTPLNTISGFAQLLEATATDAEQRSMAASIVSASAHVNGLVQDLLDYSKAEANALEPVLVPVSVRSAVDAALDLVAGAARETQVTIDTQAGDEWVIADRRHLVQALLNLLSNAVKYGGQGSTVFVTTSSDDVVVRCSITDEGPGIAPELQQRAFRPFERLGNTEFVDGVGLGLSIADSFVRTMHGHLTLTGPPGAGATFTIELPRSSRSTDDTDPIDDAAAPANQLVLYVEDEPLNASLVESIVALLPGRSLHVEPTVKDGIAAVHRLRPALILLDVNLPDGSGLDVLAAVRADPAIAGAPVFILSADATEQAASRALELGADRFITKPFNLKEFVALVDAATAVS